MSFSRWADHDQCDGESHFTHNAPNRNEITDLLWRYVSAVESSFGAT